MGLEKLVLLVISFVIIEYSSGYKTNLAAGSTVHEELPCITIGGLCVLTSDCPDSHHVPVKGLCPLQQKSGVECCYALPISETRCQKRGGECIEEQQKCPPNLIFSRATDCGVHKKCCILVN